MSALHRLLPHRCHLCAAAADQYLCPPCWADLPRLEHACPVCALPLTHRGAACGDCLKQPKPYEQTLIPWLYAHPLDFLLQRLKAGRAVEIARVLGPELLNLVNTQTPQPDALVPVPLHRRRLLRRGYNQARCLSDYLAARTGLPVVDNVRKVAASSPQKSLNRRARLRNLRHGFRCRKRLDDRHLVIVDDVVTTGATAIRLSECLLAAGARRVDIWALARTP